MLCGCLHIAGESLSASFPLLPSSCSTYMCMTISSVLESSKDLDFVRYGSSRGYVPQQLEPDLHVRPEAAFHIQKMCLAVEMVHRLKSLVLQGDIY